MNYLVAMASCLGFFPGGFAQEKPKDLPPVLRVIVKVEPDKGRIIYKEITHVNEPVRKKEFRRDGIAVVEVDVFEDRIVPVEGEGIIDIGTRHLVRLDGSGWKRTVEARFITTDGKELAMAEVWKRLKTGTVIAVSLNGETPTSEFLRALHPDTVVVVPDAVKTNAK